MKEVDDETLSALLTPLSPATWFGRYAGREGRAVVRRARLAADRWGPSELAVLIGSSEPGQVDWLEGGLARPWSGSEAADALLAHATTEGASLRVHRVQTLDPELRALALAFVGALGEEINLNAYASGARSRGLAPHSDPYDLFVLQTHGTKRWHLEGWPDNTSPIPFDEDEGGTVGRVDLQAGDLLFLPAHLRHRAEVIDGPSLHLTLSVLTKTPRSLIEWIAHCLEHGAGEAPFSPRCQTDADPYDRALQRLRSRADRLLSAPDAAKTFLAYREGLEYERTLTPFSAYRLSQARIYR